MIWFWTSPVELMDEEQGLMAALIRMKWLCALIKYLGLCRTGRQCDMLCGFRLGFRTASSKSDMPKPSTRSKKNKWNTGINNISNKWDDKKIKHFYFCSYHLSMSKICTNIIYQGIQLQDPVYKTTVITISITRPTLC